MRAARGEREVDGRVEKLAAGDVARRVRAVARQVNVKTFVVAILLTAAVALCPA